MRESQKVFLKKYALFFSWVIALIAMLSTLFAQYFINWPVCPLCWYQRICIYPLVVLLGIAAFKDEKTIIFYALPFPAVGFLFAVYQYCEQMIPGFEPIKFCTQGVACNTIHLKLWGFITIPFLSATSCVLIFIFLICARD